MAEKNQDFRSITNCGFLQNSKSSLFFESNTTNRGLFFFCVYELNV